MLEEHEKSIRPTRRIELAPLPVEEAMQTLSYAQRYELVCQRLVRERLYDAACFLTSNAQEGVFGRFIQPNPELGIRNFAVSLAARVRAFAELAWPPQAALRARALSPNFSSNAG